VRIVLWHGFLLGGTGSNVYTRSLAREWSHAGHDVTVFSQEPHPERYDLGGARHIRPEIGGPLPTFVLDRYERHEPRLLQDLTREERDRYVELNAVAVREQLPADLVFANHVLLGGPVGAAAGARFAVKAHGSELEYSRGNADLAAWGRESLAGAAAVFVGSEHIREVLEDVVGHVDRVHEVPPVSTSSRSARAARGSARPSTCCSRPCASCTRGRRSWASATTARTWSAWHRRGPSSLGRSSTSTSSTCSRSPL
jgi:hypothetical protein